MKNLLIAFILFALSSSVLADPPQEPEQNQEQEQNEEYVKRQPSVEDYKMELKYLEHFVDSFDDVKFYKGWELRDRSTNKSVKIADLTPLQRSMFYLQRAEILNARIQYMSHAWLQIKSRTKPLTEKEKKLEEKLRPASREDLSKFLGKLHTLHKKLAVSRENFIKNLINTADEFDDELESEEIANFKRILAGYLKKVEKYNEKNDLK